MEVSQKFKNRSTKLSSNYTSVYIPKGSGFRGDICTPMLILALFTTDKICKQLKYPLIDEWIKKTYYEILLNLSNL